MAEEPENEVPLHPCFPREPIVALDAITSAEFNAHPFDAARDTVAQASNPSGHLTSSGPAVLAAGQAVAPTLVLDWAASALLASNLPQKQQLSHAAAPAALPQSFATSPSTLFIAREGHEEQYVRALVQLFRSKHTYTGGFCRPVGLVQTLVRCWVLACLAAGFLCLAAY